MTPPFLLATLFLTFKWEKSEECKCNNFVIVLSTHCYSSLFFPLRRYSPGCFLCLCFSSSLIFVVIVIVIPHLCFSSLLFFTVVFFLVDAQLFIHFVISPPLLSFLVVLLMSSSNCILLNSLIVLCGVMNFIIETFSLALHQFLL